MVSIALTILAILVVLYFAWVILVYLGVGFAIAIGNDKIRQNIGTALIVLVAIIGWFLFIN